jgi:cystathionine beta-lyase
MKYDFTSILDRRGKDAAAYDNVGAHVIAPARPKEGFDIIPMWVADMNFPVVPTITEAIIARAQHPSFGYFFPTDKYYDSIVQWHEKRNGVTGLTKEHIGYENGVLGGVVSALNVLCSRGDNVLVHSPTYSGFTSCLTNAGYSIVLSPLVQDEQGIWRMDFEDMEKKIVANHIHTALFSPHNPTGRVWER